MLHPDLDKEKKDYVQFRDSMKKFTMTSDNHTFSVVDHSEPYSHGRLNNDIIVLLSTLGITNEVLLRKQKEYFNWIDTASTDLTIALDFVCSLGQYPIAERLLLEGIDAPAVRQRIHDLQTSEVASFKKNDRMRSRMIIRRSRLLFGVCDPDKLLQEGEVHVRITDAKGVGTIVQTDVLVVRNPCLHPGIPSGSCLTETC